MVAEGNSGKTKVSDDLNLKNVIRKLGFYIIIIIFPTMEPWKVSFISILDGK